MLATIAASWIAWLGMPPLCSPRTASPASLNKSVFGMIQIALDQPGRYQKAAIMRDWA
jgi:hypothetical protein